MIRTSLLKPRAEIREIYHELSFKASLAEVFEALTNASQIDEWGGGPARVQARTNGRYSLWDGEMYGIIKEIEYPTRLVHSLRESNWSSECLDSIVTWELEETERGGTLLKLTHTGLPNRKICEVHNEGWGEYFLGPLKVYLDNNKKR